MRTVGMYEAKTHFSQLVDEVEHGETIMITRHGQVVARLVPAPETRTTDTEAVIAALRELRRGVTLGDLTIRDLIEEGRRY